MFRVITIHRCLVAVVSSFYKAQRIVHCTQREWEIVNEKKRERSEWGLSACCLKTLLLIIHSRSYARELSCNSIDLLTLLVAPLAVQHALYMFQLALILLPFCYSIFALVLAGRGPHIYYFCRSAFGIHIQLNLVSSILSSNTYQLIFLSRSNQYREVPFYGLCFGTFVLGIYLIQTSQY